MKISLGLLLCSLVLVGCRPPLREDCRSTRRLEVDVRNSTVTVSPQRLQLRQGECVVVDVRGGARIERVQLEGGGDSTADIDLSTCRATSEGWCAVKVRLTAERNSYRVIVRDRNGIERRSPEVIDIEPPGPCLIPPFCEITFAFRSQQLVERVTP